MDYFETLQRWYVLQATIAQLKAEEQALREGLFVGTFVDPREGVNSITLPDGRVLKGTYVLNRRLVREEYMANWSKLKIPSQIGMKLIKTEYSLVLGEYKKLPEELRQKVDTVVETKPGLPKLELVPAKES